MASSHLGACVGQLAVRLLGHRLERTRVDDVEQIALMHNGAVLELDGVDEAADAGAHLHLLRRLEAAGEFVPIGDGALDRLGDGHRRGRRCTRLRRRLAATGESEYRNEKPGDRARSRRNEIVHFDKLLASVRSTHSRSSPKAAEKAGYASTRGRHKMGRNDELFKTIARAMLGRMPRPDGGLTRT
ncbi:hypothetical protein ACVWWR_003636 [Bradyrhizobium sp. LM3.2]